eukprot:CAMPEP_0170564166 /NCGR_PEP_ID=MMETSP0211-20121228/71456_1 /TAXON_ID=311385 /ORGANISM="Pseudokeronopsis sp., Strain OXSARD2" /LENGTH=123 /DNA_ID=CAMNT_0010883319 /DNA_START=94 /DNA_END=465 /DNA_ORIENTATION=+
MSTKEQMFFNLFEGANTPLTAENKGYQMLQKLGFKQGEGLGKKDHGRTAPLPLVIKNGKFGIKYEELVQERKDTRIKFNEATMNSFQSIKSREYAVKKVKKKLEKLRKFLEGREQDPDDEEVS